MILPICGFTKTPLINDFGQNLLRLIFAYISIEHTDESKGPWIWLAFVAFGVVETIRYPFYISKILGIESTKVGRVLGHLRYNLFIPFYPIGAFADGMALYYSLDKIKSEDLYSIHMPNAFNYSFDYVFFAYAAVLPIYIFGFPVNYKVLFSGRAKLYK